MRIAAQLGVLVAGCVLSLSAAEAPHHSHGNYEMTEYTRLEGTVREIHWINPHSWIYMEVINEEGQAELWALEGANVAQLRRRGWTEDSIKPGDSIAVRCHRLRDRSNGCLLGFVTPEGGDERIFD